MTDFGGMGGIKGGRTINHTDAFEATVDRVLGDAIRGDDETAEAMWSALANVSWTHANGDTAGYTFRAAGDLVAAIRGKGDYVDWYCSGPSGVVRRDIAQAMAAEGWTWESDA